MSNCKQCGKEVVQKEGRRKRLFCSDSCRQKAWQKKKSEEKFVRLPKNEYQELLAKIAENNRPDILAKIIEQRNTPNNIGKKHQQPLLPINAIPRLEGESTLDYKIRISELNP